MINLLFTGNDKIFDGLAIALISITKYNKEALNVYVLTMDLSNRKPEYKAIDKDKILKLEAMIKKTNAESRITLIDTTDIFRKEHENSVNMNTSYSPYCFVRLLADEVESIPDKVLYLDIDVVANGDIKELYNYDISNYEYGAVKDYYGKVFINPHYINSGVMLLNMKKIRETKLFKRCREFINVKKLGFPDQTALNKLAVAKLYLPSKFNSQRRYHKTDIIRHFCKSIRWLPWFHTINVKPWNIDGMHQRLKCYEFDKVLEEYQAFIRNEEKG